MDEMTIDLKTVASETVSQLREANILLAHAIAELRPSPPVGDYGELEVLNTVREYADTAQDFAGRILSQARLLRELLHGVYDGGKCADEFLPEPVAPRPVSKPAANTFARCRGTR